MPNTNTNTTTTSILCECCSRDFTSDEIQNAEHEDYETVCCSCHTRNFRYSDRIDTYVHNDNWDSSIHDYEEEDNYEDDDDDRPESSEWIYGYSSGSFRREPPLFKPYENYTPNQLVLGIENEVQIRGSCHLSRGDLAYNITQCDLKNFAIIKEDSSIGYGFEIVSKPATFEYHKTAWDLFFTNTAKYLRSFRDSTTGLHIHINQTALSKGSVGRIWLFINADVNKSFIDAISGRAETSYCRRKKDPKYSDLNRSRDRGAFHYYCDTSPTHEFRCFSGNVKKESFFKTLEFVVSLCHYVSNECSNINPNYLDFCNYVKSKHFEYPYLFNWLIDRGYLKHLGRLKQKTKFYLDKEIIKQKRRNKKCV